MKFLEVYVSVLYCIEIVFSVYVFIRFIPFFANRFRNRVVHLFHFTAWLFIALYAVMNVAGLILRLSERWGYPKEDLRFLGYLLWAITHSGMTAALVLVAYLVWKRRSDMYIAIQKRRD